MLWSAMIFTTSMPVMQKRPSAMVCFFQAWMLPRRPVLSLLFEIIESPHHPNFTTLYQRLGYQLQALTSSRKAISQLKKEAPDVVVADFVYGYSNNYSGVHISNLDVFLMSLAKFAPQARVIILAAASELAHAEKMRQHCEVAAILPFTTSEADLAALLD